MEVEPEEIRTFKQKMLFYTTAFFILLGTFSLFAFLFLVPFVIDPAFTTIFMEFDPVAALCVTLESESLKGVGNCSGWSSCREGCTKEIYECTHIYVNYKLPDRGIIGGDNATEEEAGEERNASADELGDTWHQRDYASVDGPPMTAKRRERAIRNDYDYSNRPEEDDDDDDDGDEDEDDGIEDNARKHIGDRVRSGLTDDGVEGLEGNEEEEEEEQTGLMGNGSEWYFKKAHLYPNVKGCGYPPILNCTIWYKQFIEIGSNFSCYYSKVDPQLVISDLDMWQVYMNLVYAMAIPIPSFIISVIYLTFAYFKIYNEDEEAAPLEENAEEMDVEGGETGVTPFPGGTPIPPTSGAITPGSEVFREDLASFGHQFKVAMADEMSRESFTDAVPIANSISMPG